MGLLGKIDRYKEAIDELRPFEGDLLSQIKNYYRRWHGQSYGAEIYRSGLLPPGKELDTIELLRPLDAGTYEGAFIRYSCLSLDGMTSLNGADVDLTLEVK